MRDPEHGSPLGRILGGIGQAVRAAGEVRQNATAGLCVYYQHCGNEIPARSFWITDRLQPRKQLLCDQCAKGAARATATLVAGAVQQGLSGILGEMLAGRERRK